MPQIIVTAGSGGGGVDDGNVMLRERVNVTDFESERFATNLLERLGWAVEDATAAEEARPDAQQLAAVAEPDPGWDPEPLGVA
jgi:hypothetical protein